MFFKFKILSITQFSENLKHLIFPKTVMDIGYMPNSIFFIFIENLPYAD